MEQSPSIREIVEFGLDTVPDRRVDVSLRDLLFVHQVLGELNRFFHQPLHYPDLKAVQRFLSESGGYEVLAKAYYKKLGQMLPVEVHEQFAAGAFEHPASPAYYKHDA